MSKDRKRGREYGRMRGEYLSLVASLEFNLTFFLVEVLDVKNYREQFYNWFTRAPIPFSWKVGLFDSINKDWGMLAQFGDVVGELRESYDFRNTLAHSFRTFGSTVTARGRELPGGQVTFAAPKGRLERARRLDSLVLSLLADHLEGPPIPISGDDFADWPP